MIQLRGFDFLDLEKIFYLFPDAPYKPSPFQWVDDLDLDDPFWRQPAFVDSSTTLIIHPWQHELLSNGLEGTLMFLGFAQPIEADYTGQ